MLSGWSNRMYGKNPPQIINKTDGKPETEAMPI